MVSRGASLLHIALTAHAHTGQKSNICADRPGYYVMCSRQALCTYRRLYMAIIAPNECNAEDGLAPTLHSTMHSSEDSSMTLLCWLMDQWCVGLQCALSALHYSVFLHWKGFMHVCLHGQLRSGLRSSWGMSTLPVVAFSAAAATCCSKFLTALAAGPSEFRSSSDHRPCGDGDKSLMMPSTHQSACKSLPHMAGKLRRSLLGDNRDDCTKEKRHKVPGCHHLIPAGLLRTLGMASCCGDDLRCPM